MNELKVFTNEEFGQVRTVEIDGEPWLVGKDVAEALGYSNTKDALLRHVDDEDKQIVQRSQFPTLENHIPKSALPFEFVNGEIPNRGLTVINESGVYSLVFSSKLPDAKKFKHWVTSEILPSIRKHGMYATDELLADPDFAIRVFEELKAEREAKKALEAQNAIQAQQIAELEPKATYYDEVLKCRDALPTSIIAKDYGWSAKKLNKFLHEQGVQYKLQGTWLLYSKYADKGYTKSETYPYEGSTGNYHTAINTKWTQAGRLFIYNLMKNAGHTPIIERNQDN